MTIGGGVRTVAAAAALASVAGLAACRDMAEARLDFSTVEKAKITDIWITGGGGEITIRSGLPAAGRLTPTGGPTPTARPTTTARPTPTATAGAAAAGEVRIDRVVRYNGAEPGKTYRIEGTALHLDTDCGLRCSVSYVIHAPAGVAVHGETGSGDLILSRVGAVDVRVDAGNVTVSGSSGDVNVVSDSGDVRASDVAGNLTVEVGAGRVEGRRLGGATTRVTSQSGDVTLSLGTAGDVIADVDAGDINLTVPGGPYQVDAVTDAGDIDVKIPDDPTGKHRLQLTTDSGDITVSAS